jgi:hypothetical protein
VPGGWRTEGRRWGEDVQLHGGADFSPLYPFDEIRRHFSGTENPGPCRRPRAYPGDRRVEDINGWRSSLRGTDFTCILAVCGWDVMGFVEILCTSGPTVSCRFSRWPLKQPDCGLVFQCGSSSPTVGNQFGVSTLHVRLGEASR